ncbi:MAG: YgeY family selenium metabolism-linked hydrolase [Calditrichia bacterium]
MELSELKPSLIREVKSLEDTLDNLLKKLIQIRSYSGEEGEIAKFILSKMQEFAFDEAYIDTLGNVVGRIGQGPLKIMYDAHIDTVQVTESESWKYPPFGGEIVGGKMYGRGVVDEKPAMVGYLIAGKILKSVFGERALPFTLYIVGSVLEEDCDGYPLYHLIRKEGLTPDAVVLGEPTNLHVYRGQRGRMEIQIEAWGKSAHGAHNEQGINAIYKLVPIVQEIAALDKRLPDREPLGKGSITVSQMVSHGPSLCSVPDYARIHIDRRLTVGETREQVLDELEEIVKKTGSDAEISIPMYRGTSWKGLPVAQEAYFPTWIMEEEHPLVQAAQETVQELFREKRPSGFWSFSTNGVATAGLLGIPTIGFAPGKEELSHSDKEELDLADLHQAALFYTTFPFILKDKKERFDRE